MVLGPDIVKFLLTCILCSLYVPAVKFNVSPGCAVFIAFLIALVPGETVILVALTAPERIIDPNIINPKNKTILF